MKNLALIMMLLLSSLVVIADEDMGTVAPTIEESADYEVEENPAVYNPAPEETTDTDYSYED